VKEQLEKNFIELTPLTWLLFQCYGPSDISKDLFQLLFESAIDQGWRNKIVSELKFDDFYLVVDEAQKSLDLCKDKFISSNGTDKRPYYSFLLKYLTNLSNLKVIIAGTGISLRRIQDLNLSVVSKDIIPNKMFLDKYNKMEDQQKENIESKNIITVNQDNENNRPGVGSKENKSPESLVLFTQFKMNDNQDMLIEYLNYLNIKNSSKIIKILGGSRILNILGRKRFFSKFLSIFFTKIYDDTNSIEKLINDSYDDYINFNFNPEEVGSIYRNIESGTKKN